MKTPTEKAKEILEKVSPHAQYWDCYNDCPLEENHTVKLALILVNEILAENKRINLGGAFPTPLTAYWKEVRKEITRKRV